MSEMVVHINNTIESTSVDPSPALYDMSFISTAVLRAGCSMVQRAGQPLPVVTAASLARWIRYASRYQ